MKGSSTWQVYWNYSRIQTIIFPNNMKVPIVHNHNDYVPAYESERKTFYIEIIF